MSYDRPLWYDLDHRPISITEANRLFADPARILATTNVDDAHVSTVFLSLDHAFGDGPPILYETMIFGDGLRVEDCWRYATREAALAGHERAVARLRDLARQEIKCHEPSCPDFGDPSMGEGTCPVEHARPDETP